jgi:hypothetical protein
MSASATLILTLERICVRVELVRKVVVHNVFRAGRLQPLSSASSARWHQLTTLVPPRPCRQPVERHAVGIDDELDDQGHRLAKDVFDGCGRAGQADPLSVKRGCVR